MIILPADFDIAALASDFFTLAVPFIKVSLLIGGGYLILNLLRNA